MQAEGLLGSDVSAKPASSGWQGSGSHRKKPDVGEWAGTMTPSPPLPSGVPAALHEWRPVLLPEPMPVPSRLHWPLLPGAHYGSQRGHWGLSPGAGPNRGPVHRCTAAPGSRGRVRGQQARHLRRPGDRRPPWAGRGAPCPACSLPGAPGARTDLSGRYQATRDGSKPGEAQGGRALGWPVQGAGDSPEATTPHPSPSAGPTPRGECACPPPA